MQAPTSRRQVQGIILVTVQVKEVLKLHPVFVLLIPRLSPLYLGEVEILQLEGPKTSGR